METSEGGQNCMSCSADDDDGGVFLHAQGALLSLSFYV
jgi:hypothetical protein